MGIPKAALYAIAIFRQNRWSTGETPALTGGQPLSDRIHHFQRLITQALEDINALIAHFPEEEVKGDVLLLLELCADYRAQVSALAQRLTAQRGWDLEI